MVICLEGLAEIAAATACTAEQLQRAAWLFGAGAALRAASGVVGSEPDRARHVQARVATQARLDADAWATAWAAGQAAPYDEVLAQAAAVPSG